MQMSRIVPLGIQSFSVIRKCNYVYVDKSHFIEKLDLEGFSYFLNRPRRFGKSLFVSMLESYYKCEKEYFKGLAIERIKAEKGDEWRSYPVLKLDLNAGDYTTADELKNMLNAQLDVWCSQFEIERKFGIPHLDFAYIIPLLYKKFGQKVVFLVDEYDKPLIATMENPELNDVYRSMLKAFFGVIKSLNSYIHISFLTGITKFSKVSIFSDLNNLNDISFDKKYSTICGITQEELEENFNSNIEELAAEYNISHDEMVGMLKTKYDGYHFSEDLINVYNPYSLCAAFQGKKLRNYWFISGTPSFMIRMLERHDINIPDLEGGVELNADDMDSYRVDYDNLPPFLFQSGYLTIKEYDIRYNRYVLGFPNDEVKYAFLERLMNVYTSSSGKMKGNFAITRFSENIEKGNIDEVLSMIKALLASIPYDSFSEEKVELREHNYQTAIYLVFTLLGQYVRSEVHSAKGRSDVEVETADGIYIFEFKVSGTVDEAIEQIKSAGYAEKYGASSKSIFLIGVAIDGDERTIKEWKVEK